MVNGSIGCRCGHSRRCRTNSVISIGSVAQLGGVPQLRESAVAGVADFDGCDPAMRKAFSAQRPAAAETFFEARPHITQPRSADGPGRIDVNIARGNECVALQTGRGTLSS